MGNDPAFLFYPADAASDMSHMNRLERGAYLDFMTAQKKFGHLSMEIIKRILAPDFEMCWASLELVLKKDECGLFFIEWVNDAIIKRKAYSKSRSQNRLKNKYESYDQHVNNICSSQGGYMEKENGIEDVNQNGQGGAGEKQIVPYPIAYAQPIEDDDRFETYQQWTELINNQQDQFFDQMLKNEGLQSSKEAVNDHLQLLARYPKMRPESQQRFRLSVIKHLKEFTKPKPSNGFHKEEKPAGPYIAPKPYQAPLTKAIHINGDGLKASISLDIEKLFKNPDFKPNAGAIKLEYLRKQGVLELSESQIKDYKSDAKGIRISELNLDYGNLDNKKLLRDHESGNLTETEKGIIDTMSKSLAYESWLSNEIEKLKEVAEI